MYLKFAVEDLKDNLLCLENDFFYDVDEEELNSREGRFLIYFSEDGEENTFSLAGTLIFHAYNVSTSFDEDLDGFANKLFCLMDEAGEDQLTYYDIFKKAFRNLKKGVNNKNLLNEYLYFSNEKYLITIDDFCIDKKFRRKGIAKYVLNNLYNIFKRYCNITPISVVGVPNPHDDEPEGMLDIQINCYNKSGFTVYYGPKVQDFYKNYIPKF